MKKMSLTLLAALMLAACGTQQVEEQEDAVNGTTGEAPTEETAEATPEEAAEEVTAEATPEEAAEEVTEEATEEAAEEEVAEETKAAEDEEAAPAEEPAQASGFKAYMPAAGLVKNFEVDSIQLTRKVLEVQENKVLEEIAFGDVKTMQITEWTENAMQMVFESAELQGITNISIAGLVPTSEPVSMIDKANTTAGGWMVIGENETLELPAGTFENVVVIEQVLTTETSAQVTTFTHYYAPGLGLVKEKTTVVNGEDEQVSEVNLVSYE